MNIVELTKDIFNVKSIKYSERVIVCEANFMQRKELFPSYNELKNYFARFSTRDNVKISITKSNEDVFYLSNESIESDLNDFLVDLDDNETININIDVVKNIIENTLSVYCYTDFCKDLIDNNIYELMDVFKGLIENRKFLVFKVYDTDIFWCTKTIAFIHDENIIFTPKIERLERLDVCKNVSYSYSSTGNYLLPDDFSILTDYSDNSFKNIFEIIRTVLSLAYISSLSSIKNNYIDGQITGQRNMTFSYDLDTVTSNEELFKIYDWIYTDGNPTDKSIIAHNILSLHCKFADILKIDDKTLSAITSNYQLYLKDNANKYLEAKDKVAEYICDTVSKIGSASIELLTDFKKNLVAVFGFIVSVLLVNIVSQQPLDNIFTKEITVIVESVLLGSIVYFIICLLETLYRYNKSKESYSELKKNYDDIFSDSEIKQIFDEDKLYNKSIKSVKRGIVIFSSLWCGTIIIGLIIIECISTNPIITPVILDIYKNMILILKSV